MVLTDKSLDELLEYLDNSISKLSNELLYSSEFNTDTNFKEFLEKQYDIRLDNLLQRKNSSIHHLESGMKNKVIQRKQRLLNSIIKSSK